MMKIKNLNLNVTKHSSAKKNFNEIDIYLVDTFGETKKFHNLAPTVFLGGSIALKGGQNPLEAVRSGQIFYMVHIQIISKISMDC